MKIRKRERERLQSIRSKSPSSFSLPLSLSQTHSLSHSHRLFHQLSHTHTSRKALETSSDSVGACLVDSSTLTASQRHPPPPSRFIMPSSNFLLHSFEIVGFCIHYLTETPTQFEEKEGNFIFLSCFGFNLKK